MAREAGAPKNDFTARDFGGINTQAIRQAIDDAEFAWLENMMPVGFGNLVAVPNSVDTGATVTSGSCYYMKAANISNTDYMFMFCNDGSAYQIKLSDYTKTQIGAAGTFSNSGVQLDQWKNERILIVDAAKGYFSWDATSLKRIDGSVISMAVTAAGSGYTGVPTVTINGGSGTGATATAIVGITGATAVTAGGAGYLVGDILTISGGTSTTAAKVVVSTIGGGGAVTAVAISVAGNYTVPPASPAATTGGTGAGCTLTPTWGVVGLTITTGGAGYTSNPSVSFSGGGGSGTTATATASVAPAGGTCVAVYSGRAWIANGRTISFSAPDSYTDFSTTNAGGSFIISDSTLHSTIQQLYSCNGFLYVVGSDSINTISDVRVSSGSTLFSNLNLVTTAGTSSPYSVVAYYRTLWLATPYGFYGITGSSAQKGSDKLDGIFQRINSFTNISAGVVVINKILCLAFLFSYNDPDVGNRALFAIYFNKKWFVASHSSTLVTCAGATLSGTQTLFATDGSKLYKCFGDNTTATTQTIKSKLWDMGEALTDKQVLKAGIETIMPDYAANISLDVDNENKSVTVVNQPSSLIHWVNNSEETVLWTNNSFGFVGWFASGYVWFRSDASLTGKYIGMTISASIPQLIVSAEQLQYEFRARW